MEMIRDIFHQLPLIGRFAVIFGLIVLLPKLAERYALPGVVGLLLGGIVLGPEVIGLIDPKNSTIELFSELGKLLLMFFAGYEIDMEQFRSVRWKAAGYGLITFSLPFALGAAVSFAFGYATNASILIGSLLASHTLLGLPIVRDLDLMRRDSVVVTVGATMITDIAAMLVLAVCLSVHLSGFSKQHLTIILVELAIYVPLVVIGLSSFVRWLFRSVQPRSDLRFAVLILMMTVSALAAQAIELEGIVGAFLTGLAVKLGLGESSEGETLSVVSHALFIPVFFLSTGFLVNLKAFASTLISSTELLASLVGILFLGKYLAAQAAGLLSGMGRDDRLLMWSLSVPQVAATLAAALVAHATVNKAGQPLIDDRMIDVVIVMIMVTSVVGPVLTRRLGMRIQANRGADS
ncbi:MAG: cation:proton antiporter [Acidobacteriota bacterium]